MVASMSGKGDCYDNAVAESFFSTLEFELLMRNDWHTREDARRAIFRYIEAWYNRRRRHSTLGYLSPAEYEAQLKLSREIGLKVAELYRALAQIRDIKAQATELGQRMQRAGLGDEASKAAEALGKKLQTIEGELTQLQGEGGQALGRGWDAIRAGHANARQ